MFFHIALIIYIVISALFHFDLNWIVVLALLILGMIDVIMVLRELSK